jgi:hypothetical protein
MEDSKLFEYINILSGGENMRLMRRSQATLAGDMEEIKNFNKERISICIPDIDISPVNLDWRQMTHKELTNPEDNNKNIPIGYGFQYVAMSFQNNDSFLKDYISEFNRHGSSFILKPKLFRKQNATVEIDNTKAIRIAQEGATASNLLNEGGGFTM